MKIALTLAAGLLAASSIAFAADNNGGQNSGNNNMPRMNDGNDIKTDPDTTGSVKCDNSNADINSGCDKPGHLKQEERMQNDPQ